MQYTRIPHQHYTIIIKYESGYNRDNRMLVCIPYGVSCIQIVQVCVGCIPHYKIYIPSYKIIICNDIILTVGATQQSRILKAQQKNILYIIISNGHHRRAGKCIFFIFVIQTTVVKLSKCVSTVQLHIIRTVYYFCVPSVFQCIHYNITCIFRSRYDGYK